MTPVVITPYAQASPALSLFEERIGAPESAGYEQLARQCGSDRARYQESKTPFIRSVLSSLQAARP